MLRLKKALRAGDIFIPSSKDYVSFWSLLLPDWESERTTFYPAQEFPQTADDYLIGIRKELDTLAHAASRNGDVRIRDGKLSMPRLKKLPAPRSLKELRRHFRSVLPRIRIEDILIETDRLCGWSRHFISRSGQSLRREDRPVLFACLVALGTNLGLAQMARSTEGITEEQLHRVWRRFVREETLKAVIAELVNYLYELPITKLWGEGLHSSSDGQRFRVHGKTLLGNLYPKMFGYYDRALTVYTHVSDQYSVFNSQVISCSAREALYVLDGLLENNSVLRPLEHSTDTAGYTEQMYGLCTLVKVTFLPRLKSFRHQRLYRIDRDSNYGRLNPILNRTINIARIREQWDPMVRVAATLLSRTKPAHVIVRKLIEASPADGLSQGITEFGRIYKTVDGLRTVSDPELRRRKGRMLNRGEERHNLAKFLFFANQGEFQHPDYEEIMNKSSALALLSNAVAVLNAVRIAEATARQRARGIVVSDEDLSHISPLMRSHIIVTGTYRFRP